VGDGVCAARVWRAVLGVEHTVVEGVGVWSRAGHRRCWWPGSGQLRPGAGRKAPRYDRVRDDAAGRAWMQARRGCT
jgi:hypothetical protein